MKNVMMILAFLLGLLVTGPQAVAESTPCNPILPTMPHRVPFKSADQTYRHSDVWLYGDSITYQTWRNLRQITPNHKIAVDAWWGRNTHSALWALRRDARRFPHRLPHTVVMAVGTNDLYQIDVLTREVAETRAALPRRVRIVWVNTYVETTENYNIADRMLWQAHGIHVASWSGVNLPVLVDRRSPLLYDGIHVTAAGCDARNRLIRSAL